MWFFESQLAGLPGALASIKLDLLRSIIVGKIALAVMLFNALRNSQKSEVVLVHKPEYHDHHYHTYHEPEDNYEDWWGRHQWNVALFKILRLLYSNNSLLLRNGLSAIRNVRKRKTIKEEHAISESATKLKLNWFSRKRRDIETSRTPQSFRTTYFELVTAFWSRFWSDSPPTTY